MKKIAIAAGLIAIGLNSGVAHADNYLTPGEIALGDSVHNGLCSFIDQHGVNRASMAALIETLYESPDVANYGDSVDVINYTVKTYCPRHWGELVSFGEGARSAS